MLKLKHTFGDCWLTKVTIKQFSEHKVHCGTIVRPMLGNRGLNSYPQKKKGKAVKTTYATEEKSRFHNLFSAISFYSV